MDIGIKSGSGGSGLKELSIKVSANSSQGADGWEAKATHQS